MRTRARGPRTGAVLAGVTLLLAACAGAPGVDRNVDVAGGQLHVWCDGGTGPAVVFLSAIGGDDSLRAIAERIADRTDACFYFRPGDGETAAPPTARTAAKDAADLHAMLEAVGVPRPIVIVAHSYGGLVAVVEASAHAHEVAGVLLVDASHPEQGRRMASLFTPDQRAISDAQYANFPYVDFGTSMADAAAALPEFPAVPLTVITATHGFASACDDGLPCEAMQSVWMDLQDQYASLTPDARHIRVDTGHYVHQEKPDLVVSEIDALIDRIGSPFPTSGG